MRAWVFACGLVGGGYALGAVVAGCGTVTCEDDRTCAGGVVPGGDSGVDGSMMAMTEAGADVVVRPDGGPCDAMKRPNEDGCKPVDGTGLFVSPKGSDATGDGTKAKPFGSIGGAIAKASAATRIYACVGTYGALSLDAKATAAVTVFGGLSCDTWGYTGEATRMAPALQGPALWMDGVTAKMEFVDLEFTALAATGNEASGAGKSSIAAFVSNSTDVTFRRVALHANAGAPGLSGAAPVEFGSTAPAGNSGVGPTPGAVKTNTCVAAIGNSTGGGGGAPGAGGVGQAGQPPISPPDPISNTGSGGSYSTCSGSMATGTNGSFGPGGAGGLGAVNVGSLSATAWLPKIGAVGSNGKTAQGGGGAGGDDNNGGGGGGPGGCGGIGGAIGAGGGASIALLIFKSTVALNGSMLGAGAGGNGGDGAAGQKGQVATTTRGTGSCLGGLGGHGGSGGGGGGGAGGVALGIGYVGNAPTIDGASVPDAAAHPGFTPGSKGVGGAKGLGGAPAWSTPMSKPGEDGKPGVDGDAKTVLALPE